MFLKAQTRRLNIFVNVMINVYLLTFFVLKAVCIVSLGGIVSLRFGCDCRFLGDLTFKCVMRTLRMAKKQHKDTALKTA